jgi:hypothetical protein
LLWNQSVKKVLTSKNRNTCKIAAFKVEKAEPNLNLEIASTNLASTQNLSASHPDYTEYGYFFPFWQRRLHLSRKSQKIGSGPLVAISPSRLPTA